MARARSLGRLRLDDRGFSLVEVTVATMLIGVALTGLAGAMSVGIKSVGGARQRSAATAIAAERIERARNLPYSEVALDVVPSHNTDPVDPDFYVNAGPPLAYDVKQDGTLLEPLVLAGAVKHLEDPVRSGPTELYTHQYVTWVDDPNITGTQDYKRVTVVVTWRRALIRGAADPSRLVTSTFVGDGTITLVDTPAPSSSATPTPSPTPSPSPTAIATCAGDTTAPTGSLTVLSGAGAVVGYTNSRIAQVRLQASDSCPTVTAEMSNDGSTYTDAAPLPLDGTGARPTVSITWTIPSGDGSKTVYARYRDGASNLSGPATATIVLDETVPTTPTNLRLVSCSTSGSNRTVTLTWNSAADTNLSGYRVYRSINSVPYALLGTTSAAAWTDTHKRNEDSVRFVVRAYDKAGNESGDSNVLTFPKNSCTPS